MTRYHVGMGWYVARGAEMGTYCIQACSILQPRPGPAPACTLHAAQRQRQWLSLPQPSLQKDQRPQDLISAAHQLRASYPLHHGSPPDHYQQRKNSCGDWDQKYQRARLQQQ